MIDRIFFALKWFYTLSVQSTGKKRVSRLRALNPPESFKPIVFAQIGNELLMGNRLSEALEHYTLAKEAEESLSTRRNENVSLYIKRYCDYYILCISCHSGVDLREKQIEAFSSLISVKVPVLLKEWYLPLPPKPEMFP